MRMTLITRTEIIYNYIKDKVSFVFNEIKALFPDLDQDYLYNILKIVECRYKLKFKRITNERYKYSYLVEVLA